MSLTEQAVQTLLAEVATVKASVTVASIAPMKRFTNRSVAISQNPMGNKWTGLDGRPFVGSR